MTKFKRFNSEKPSTLHRQAMNALRRGDAVRAHDLFLQDGDFTTAARLLSSTVGLVILRLKDGEART